MSDSSLYIRDGNKLQRRGSTDSWKILRDGEGAAIPSPLGGVSIHLPSVLAEDEAKRVRAFQQASPKFWVMVKK